MGVYDSALSIARRAKQELAEGSLNELDLNRICVAMEAEEKLACRVIDCMRGLYMEEHDAASVYLAWYANELDENTKLRCDRRPACNEAWRKLLQDADECPCTYYGKEETDCTDCEHEGRCNTEQKRDLVRRAMGLAGVELDFASAGGVAR